MKYSKGFLFALSGLMLFGIWGVTVTLADIRKQWTPKTLFESAELVAIVEAESSVATQDRINLLKKHGQDVELGGLLTKVNVKHIFKGKCDQTLQILHHEIIKCNEPGIVSPPHLFQFSTESLLLETKGKKILLPTPQYLVYLNPIAGTKDRFQLAGGYMDEADSAFEMNRPWSHRIEK